jgi:hypothetical protein
MHFARARDGTIHYGRCVMFARLLALALGLLLFLPALAYATPPDPTWIGGFYDDNDYDDVVILLASEPSPLPAAFVRCPDPHGSPVWLIPVGDEQLPPPALLPRRLSRGPPLP